MYDIVKNLVKKIRRNKIITAIVIISLVLLFQPNTISYIEYETNTTELKNPIFEEVPTPINRTETVYTYKLIDTRSIQLPFINIQPIKDKVIIVYNVTDINEVYTGKDGWFKEEYNIILTYYGGETETKTDINRYEKIDTKEILVGVDYEYHNEIVGYDIIPVGEIITKTIDCSRFQKIYWCLLN